MATTSQTTLAPRKKFSLHSEIALALRRYNLLTKSDGNGWRTKLDRNIAKKVCLAYHDKFLYVNGTDYSDYVIPVSTIPELLEYIKLLPVPKAVEESKVRRLKSIPLFSGVKRPVSNCGNWAEKTHDIRDSPTVLLKKYRECENFHKVQESHHPDGIGWASGINSTIECVFDVFNSLLRTNSLSSAYNKIFSILLSDKFSNLDLMGIYFAFLHISIRGVANSETFYTLSNWRREPVSQELLFKVSQDYANGIPPQSLVAAYIVETLYHAGSINLELKRLRMPGQNHDHTKFRPDMIFYYSWHWGIYNRFDDTNKHRFNSGIFETVEQRSQRVFEAPGECNPTMFSIGSSIGQGISESPAVMEIIDLLRTLPDKVGDRVDQSISTIDTKLDRHQHMLKDNLSEITEKTSENTSRISEEILEKVVEKSSAIGDNLMRSFSPVVDALNSFKTVIETIISNVSEFFKPIPGFSKLKINANTIYDGLVYYILYINTTSTAVKTILAVLILKTFGLLQTAYSEILRFWSWTQDEIEYSDGKKTIGSETSSGLFDWIISTPTAIIKIIAGVISTMVKGIPLSVSEFMSLSKTLADKLKNFHFISQGIAGIGKIFEYFRKAYEVSIEWILVNILGRTPEKEKFSKQAVKLMIKIKYFHTESGMNAIRMNENMRQQAEAVLAEYISLQATFKMNKEYRHLFNDLEKMNRQVKEVSDFVTRLRSMSNFQPTMFHMQFVGRPGIGKSTITKNVVSDLSRTLWPEEPKASFYSYNTDLEYFDGYAGQKIMIVDDLYKINDPKHLTTSMFLVTNTPVILPMANLNDKGVQMTSEVLLSSTNTAYPIGKDVLCMEAIHRRRHMLVEVQCDPDVLDQSLGQFSMALFKQKYKNQDISKFPHLKFNLLRPVPKEFGGAMTVDANEFDVYKEYAEKLKAANISIAMANHRLDPTYYFSEENKPPQGISLPATGWTYEQLISNCAVRFAAFRGAEGSYTTQRKYIHVEQCFAEIDALLDQHDDIPDGDSIPITKAIEELLCRAQHPFGTTDPIGEKIHIEKEDPAPELADIDLEEIVNKILEETKPTSDGISLDEERERTQNILNRRGRSIIDPLLRDQLKIIIKDDRKLIPITSHFTSWYEPPVASTDNIGVALNFLLREGYLKDIEITKLQEIEDPSWIRIIYEVLKTCPRQGLRNNNNIIRWALSEEMVYPNKPEFGSNAGQNIKLPIAFFRDMKYIDHQWYLDVTEIDTVPGLEYKHAEMVPYAGGPKYNVKMDIAFLLSTSQVFRAFANEFDAMTLDQQRLLVEDARWRSQYTGCYTYEYMSEQCTNIFAKLGYKTLHYITSPIRYFSERYPAMLGIISYMLIYVSVIYALTKLSELFQPNPTSKHLHKAPQSSMLFHGRPTAQNSNLYEIAKSLVSRSVREVVISDSNCGSKVQALFSEQYIILNKHCFKYITDNEILISIQSTTPDKEFIRYIINKSNIYQDPDGDLAIIYSQNFPAMRKVTQHLITEAEYNEHDFPEDLIFLSNSKYGVLIDHHSDAVKHQNLRLRNKQYQNIISDAILVKGTTMAGRSGSPVVTTIQNRPRIVGIQAWEVDIAISPKIAIQILTIEKFTKLQDELIKQLKVRPVVRLDEPELCDVDGCETSAFEQVDPVNIIRDDNHYVGQVASSQIKPSIIYDSLNKMGIQTESVPAALNKYDKRLYHGTKLHPLAHSLGKYFRGNIEPFCPELLDYCAQNLSSYLTTKLDRQNFRILDTKEAIVGTREDGSNPMNLKTSPGIPFIFEQNEEKGKRPYIQVNEEGHVQYINPKFLKDYYIFLESLKERKVPYTRAYDFPKDELRPRGKALGTDTTPPKTRSVTCMNMFYILAWRQVTLDFWAAMHRAADGTMAFCPGINPEGPEWNNLYHYLNKHPNAVDFDVSNWDGFLRSDLFYKTCDIVKQQCKLDDQHSNIIDSIAYEVMNSYIQFGNIIYQKGRGLVSGFPGTAEINSLSHWLLILYIYMILTKNTVFNTFAAFLKHVSIAIYGDDILITFSDEIKEIFNGLTISEIYKLIGYPVTSADKNQEIQKTKPLLKCTFLKSTWRELFPHYYVRKMDQNVIHNLVLWVRSRQDPKQQFYENYMDALRLAFGAGPSVFYKFRECVNLALARSGRDIIAFDYLDFERDYMQRYIPQFYTNSYHSN